MTGKKRCKVTRSQNFDGTQDATQSAASGAGPDIEGDRSDSNAETNTEVTSNNQEAMQYRMITVHRANIRRDMIDIFKDPSIMNCHIMVDERGTAEQGIGAGVFKDALSLLWKDVYDSLMLGEGKRVAFIRHNCQRKEWEAIARILLTGCKVHQYFPLRLLKTFVASCLFDESAISDGMLLE